MLQNLFNNNKLEYVYVINEDSSSNIVSSFIIRENIETLKFMYVHYYEGVYAIKLNVSQTTPGNLRIFDVETEKGGVRRRGTIEGDDDKVKEIKEKLIH